MKTKLRPSPPIVPGWKIKKQLGEGDFATVWLAERPAEKRPRAIKVLRSEHEGKFTLDAEWDALSHLKHPGIVAGHSGDGQHIVMDYVEGPALADDMQAGKLWPIAETVEILSYLCDALASVHAAGLVHHDVNPGNIILAKHPVLIDFGWVTLAGLHTNRKRHSRWCSPEAARGEPASVLNDLWPIPLFAQVMLTGLSPIFGDPMGVGLMLRCYDGFERLPEDPNLPPTFAPWFTKATHPNPTKRYRTAATLKKSLARLSRGHAGQGRHLAV